MSYKLEQLEFKLEKILGSRNMQEKLEKMFIWMEGMRINRVHNVQAIVLCSDFDWMPTCFLYTVRKSKEINS